MKTAKNIIIWVGVAITSLFPKKSSPRHHSSFVIVFLSLVSYEFMVIYDLKKKKILQSQKC